MSLKPLWPVVNQFQNKNGSILTAGKVYVYYKNRTELAEIFSDEAGTVVNANPVLLDNNGRATVFADTIYSYTIVVCDYYGKELFSQDITLHDAIATAKDIVILSSDGSVKVDKTELPNCVQYDLSGNKEILATKEYVNAGDKNLQNQIDSVKEDVTEINTSIQNIDGQIQNINTSLENKKDRQTELNFNGSSSKTIKKITQYPNGELDVEFEDISLESVNWITLTATPYDSTIEFPILNVGFSNGLLYFNGSIKKKDNLEFTTNKVNYLFYVEGVKLSLDFRNYYGSASYNSSSSLFPCAMAGLKDNNLFYIYPTQRSNIFYFNGIVPAYLI